jgi:hypothetical protein
VAAECTREPLDVPMHSLLVGQLDRADAVREHDMGHRGRVEEPHGEVRKVGHVIGLELRAAREAGEALVHVRAEAGLAHLAVTDDVDPGGALLLDNLRNRSVDTSVQRCGVDRLAVHPRPDHVREIIGTRKAPRVGRQDPLSHLPLPPVISPTAAAVAVIIMCCLASLYCLAG